MPTEQTSTWPERTAKAVLLIRILVGWVFLSESIQKFLFPDSLGVGRFEKSASICRRSWLHLCANWQKNWGSPQNGMTP